MALQGKKLILVRHAKSLHEPYVNGDIERHLAPRGYEDALESALWLKSHNHVPELFVSSPAIRAYSTALIFANACGIKPDSIFLSDHIYEARVETLLYLVNSLPENFQSIALFGHNPGFTDLVNVLCGPTLPHLPTSGVVVLESPSTSWSAIEPGEGKLKEVFSSHKEI